MRPVALPPVLAISLAGVFMGACHDGGEGDPCLDVDCSGHGTCFDDGSRAQCDCFPGFLAQGLECLPDGSDGDADADADADTTGSCSSFASCSDCVAASGCGWCDDTDHCTEGDYAGPDDDSCDWLDWDWAGCE